MLVEATATAGPAAVAVEEPELPAVIPNSDFVWDGSAIDGEQYADCADSDTYTECECVYPDIEDSLEKTAQKGEGRGM